MEKRSTRGGGPPLRAARTTADHEHPLEASEAVDFTSQLAGALLGQGPAAVENEEATMIEANVKESETCRPPLNMSGHRGGPETAGPGSKQRF
jgi:hypothetical protein